MSHGVGAERGYEQGECERVRWCLDVSASVCGSINNGSQRKNHEDRSRTRGDIHLTAFWSSQQKVTKTCPKRRI